MEDYGEEDCFYGGDSLVSLRGGADAVSGKGGRRERRRQRVGVAVGSVFQESYGAKPYG